MTPFQITDTPTLESEITDTLATPVTGIPQSTANPLLDVFGQPDYRDDHEKAMDAWRQESATALDAAVIDPKSYGDERVPHGFTPDEWRKTRVVDDFMRLHMDGEAPPMDLSREFTRARLAQQVFGGAGAESDDALFGEITKAATGRKDERDLATELTVAAFDDAMLPGDKAPGYGAFREKLKAHAGYRAENEADYAEAWHETRRAAAEKVEEFREPLVHVWRAFKTDGNVTAAAYDAYSKLTPEQRPQFMDALAIRARALPDEERATFWANMGKATGQAVSDYGRNAAESFTSMGLAQPTDPMVGIADSIYGTDSYASAEAGRTKAKGEFQQARNFAADVRKVAREDYDPIQSAFGDGKPGFWENVAYQAPGVTATSLTMAVPVVGVATMAFAMEGQAYETLRGRMLASGLDDATATTYAEGLAPFVALPQVALEKVGYAIWSRKLPGFSKVMDTIGDKIANRALRFGAKTLTIGTAETGIELLQDVTNYAVQDIAAALTEDVPDVDWSKELSGTWAQAPEIFATMLPLAILGAAGGLNAESQQAAFARSSPTELEAFGISPDGIAAIQGAQGPASLASAIESAMETRDPNSETAQAAVGALKLQLASQRQAQADLENLGYEPPTLVRSAAGITVFDADGQELGTAPDLAGAVRISNVHTAALEDMTSEYVASLTDALEKEKATAKRDALGTLMEATDAAVKLDPQSTLNVEMRAFDPRQASAGMAASYAQQVALKEKAEGGSGNIARSVLGYSVTEFAQGQRQTVNTIFESASVTDAFHETAHGLRRGAHKAGALTLKHDIALLRSEDTILAGKFAKSVDGKAPGVAMRFIPEGLTDEMLLTGAIPAEMIPPEFHGNGKLYVEKIMDEGVSEITESEVFRPKKGQGKGRLGIGRGVVSRNITALTKLMPGVIGDWVAYFRAVRAQWGLATSRTVAMRGAERRGEWDRSTRDAYLDKLLGLDAQTEHDAGVQTELDRIMGLPDEIADDDIPFSIGSRYQGFRLRPDGPTRYVKSNTGVLYPDSHEIKTHTAPPGTQVDKGLWSRLVDDGRRTDLPPERETAATVAGTGIIDQITRHAKSADRSKPFWPWFVGTLNGDDFRGMDPVDILDEVVEVLHLESPVSEQGVSQPLVYAQISQDGAVLVADTVTGEFSFGVLPTAEELAEAQFIHDSNPSEYPSFSIGPAKVADIMAGNALKRITDPRRRTQVMSRIARDFDAMRLQIDRMASLSGIRRSKGDLRREAMAREDLRAEELIADVHRRFGEIMADEDLVKIKSQPVHAALADPDSPLRGRLKSKAAAIREHPDMFQLHRAGDYDGSDGVSRSVFGGQRMPDQAAQELYDDGLIPEPTADALWEALLGEQRQVASMKEFLQKAKEQIREAKAQAKQEATEWLATQGKDQEVNFSDKEEIRRSLRMLDAILLALPPEIRGKIGGYTQISMIGTDEARLAYLKDKLAKADKELETFLRVEYAAEWEALLKKAAPATNAPGQRPTGSIAADAYDIFRVAEAAMGMSFAEGEAEADKWDAIADHPDTELKDVDMARVKAQMIRLTMNWPAADAARREQAVLEGEKIYYNGLLALKVEASRRRERLGNLRESVIQGTGKSGVWPEIDAANVAANTETGKVKKLAWSFLSFGQLVNVIAGENSEFAKWASSKQLAADNASHDGFQAKANALESLFDTLSGNRFDGEKLRHRMANVKSITVKDVLGVTYNFSEAQAIDFLLTYRQEDGKRHMDGIIDDEGNILSSWAWSDATAQEVADQLSKEGRAAMAFLGQSYGEEYDRINAVFRRIWNVMMPKHKMYAPISTNVAKGSAIMDPASGDVMSASMTPGSLKNRSFTAVAEIEFKDAFQKYIQHARQMEHFIAYGEFTRDLLAVVNAPKARAAIRATSGPVGATVLSKWIDWMALGGIHQATAGDGWTEYIGGMLGRLSQAALVGRVSVLCMQSLQLAAASFKMPTGAFLTRFAKLTAGRLQWGDTIQSDYVQRRVQQLPPVVRDMMQGMASGTPNRAKFLAGKVAMTIPGADALFTAGTYAMFYDYHLGLAKKSRMANPEAHAHAEAERLTDQVAQPVRTGARSWLEVANAGNPAFRAAWNFSSDPRQKMSLLVYAAMRRDTTGKEKVADVTFTAAKLWIIGGVMQALLRTILRDLRNDDDDEIFDERYWDPARLALQVATGPLGAVPFLGGMMEDATYKLTGQFMPQGGMLAFLDQAAGLPKKWAGGKFEPIKDVEALTTAGAGLSGTSAAAASAMHLIRDVVGFIENLEGPD